MPDSIFDENIRQGIPFFIILFIYLFIFGAGDTFCFPQDKRD